MRVRNLIWVSLGLLVVSCGGQKIDYTTAKLEDVYRPYQIKSATIKYEYKGDWEGYEELTFDDYGWKQKRYYKKKPRNATVWFEGLDIIMPDYIISINMSKRVGSKRPNVFIYQLRKRWDNADPETRKSLGPKIQKFAKQMNLGLAYHGRLKSLTEESGIRKTVAGKKCEVYKLLDQDLRLFVWENIVLGTEALTPGGKTIIMEATEIKENPSIPVEAFVPPADVKLTEYTTDSLYVKNEMIFMRQLLDYYLGTE